MILSISLTTSLINSTDAVAARPKKPSVSSVAPAAGPVSGGTRVTLTGSNFRNVKAVTFGTSAGLAIKVLSSARLQVTAPRRNAGYTDIRVRTTAGTSPATSADRYRYIGPPAVRKLSVNRGSTSGGNFVTLTGTSFVNVRAVLFGSTRSRIVSRRSDTTLVVRVPAGRAGTVNIRVITAYGRSAPSRYTYVPVWRGVANTMLRTGGLTDMSCIDEDFCAAVDENGAALVIQNGLWQPARVINAPAPGIDSTDKIRLPNKLTTVSCVDPAFCLAGGTSGALFRWNGTSWAPMAVGSSGAIETVACSSRTVCFLSSAGAPGGAAQLWHFDGSWREEYSRASNDVLACTLSGPCVFRVGNEYRSYTVADGVTRQGGAPAVLATLACPSDDVCLGVTTDGKSYRYDDGTWSGPTTIPLVSPLTEPRLDCATISNCVLVGYGQIYAYNGTAWSNEASSVYDPRAPECVPTACLVFNASRLTGVGANLESAPIDPYLGGVAAVDCATATFCVAVGVGDAYSVMRGSTWTTPARSGLDGDYRSISCPTASFCLAVGDNRTAMFDGTTWTAGPAKPTFLREVACSSPTYCVAIGVNSAYLYVDGSWAPHSLPPNFGGGVHVSCAQPRFCMVTAFGRYMTVVDGAWSADAALDGGAEEAVSCLSPTMCLAVSRDSVVIRWNGTTWVTSTTLSPAVTFSFDFDIDCASVSACTIVNPGANGLWTFNGTSWSGKKQIGLRPGVVSCPTAAFCVAADELGHTQIYR